MFFLNMETFLLVLCCPTIVYQAVMGQVRPLKRWQIILWSALGGSVAGMLGICILILSERDSAYYAAGEWLRSALAIVAESALFGAVLALTALLTRAESERRLLATGLVLLGLAASVPAALKARLHLVPDDGGWALVLAPDSLPLEQCRYLSLPATVRSNAS